MVKKKNKKNKDYINLSKKSMTIGKYAILTLFFSTIFTFGTISAFDYYELNPIYLVVVGFIGLVFLLVIGRIYTLTAISNKKR